MILRVFTSHVISLNTACPSSSCWDVESPKLASSQPQSCSLPVTWNLESLAWGACEMTQICYCVKSYFCLTTPLWASSRASTSPKLLPTDTDRSRASSFNGFVFKKKIVWESTDILLLFPIDQIQIGFILRENERLKRKETFLFWELPLGTVSCSLVHSS